MTTRNILLCLGLLTPSDMDRLATKFEIVKLWEQPDPEAFLHQKGPEIRAILSRFNGIHVTRVMMEAMPNLEIITQFGAGVDNIDLAAATDRQILVTNTPDEPTAATADLAMTLILTLLRRVVEADAFVRSGRWMSDTFGFGTDVGGKRLGIVGMGRLGQAIAKRAAAFDMQIAYHGPREKADITYPYYADITRLAINSDILVLSCPGGNETRNLVGEKVLKALGPSGFLVNVARGSVVDFAALEQALDQNLIAGAALDVYPAEPCLPDALVPRDNVVLVPHIGGRTHETRDKMSARVLENLMAYAQGKKGLDLVKM
ncbi:MAG: 2-hydroxyacid dehydrogenase [Pseudomonadota bacterium]